MSQNDPAMEQTPPQPIANAPSAWGRVPAEARDVVLAVNPRAGARSGRARLDQLARDLREQGFQVQEESCPDAVSELAAKLLGQQRLRAVVAAGGDGTVSLVANRTPPGTPLAVLPLGTENLFSKYLGIAPDPRHLVQIIVQGRTLRLDAGLANQRLFLLMAGVGFDAEVVQRLHATRTGHIRHWSYIKPILDSLRSYEYPPLQVYCEPVVVQPPAASPERMKGNAASLEGSLPDRPPAPAQSPPSPKGSAARGKERGEQLGEAGVGAGGETRRIEARWAFVVNLPRYAGGLQFAPLAVGTDGLLDVCTFQRGSLVDGLRYLWGVSWGSHVGWPDCQIVPTPRVRITSELPVPYQLDGDPAGLLPLEIEVVQDRLTVLLDEHWPTGGTGGF